MKWVKGKDRKGNEVLVPAQAVFLFSAIAFGTRAFATTVQLASRFRHKPRVCAPLRPPEIIERDAHATTPLLRASLEFCASNPGDQRIQGLLDDYAAPGNIFVQFQDITTEVGVPRLPLFCDWARRNNLPGGRCGPEWQKAALSALTETPWDYSFRASSGKASMPPIRRMPRIYLEDLPNYELPGSISASLNLVEVRWKRRGWRPVYVDFDKGGP